jgi:arylsulfatase A-like enzyme
MTNRRSWQSDEDRPTSRLFADACNWLDNNTLEGIPFYLHIETYSPHEFWDPPEEFYQPYMKSDYSGPRLIFPPWVTTNLSPVEIEHARALYYGMVTFVDSRLGRLIAKLDDLDLWQNTVVAITADHGTMLGEQGQFHKDEGRLRTQVTRVPLIIYHPRLEPRRIKGYVQHTDMMPTLLQILGIDTPSRVTGRSLVPYMQSGDSVPGDRIVTGWADHGAIRTPEWLYQGRWNPGDAYEELYDLRKDPLELTNVNQQNPKLIEDFRRQLKEYVDAGWETTRGTFAKAEEDS